MRIHLFVGMLLTAACLAGCNSDDGISGRVGYGVTYHNTNVQFQYGDLTIPAADLPPAKTNRNGDFMVANVSQVISTPQRQLLTHYYVTALDLCDNLYGTEREICDNGKRGILLVQLGKPDDQENLAHQRKICKILHDLESTQKQLDTQLEAFRPYGVIQGGTVQGCPADAAT